VGVLAGLSPHTGAVRLVPSIIGGSLVAGATYVVLRRRRAAGGGPAEPALQIEVSPLAWLCLFASLLAFAPTLGWLIFEYTYSIWRNGHGLFLPLIIFALSRRALRRAELPAQAPSAWGLPLVVAGCALSLIDATARTSYLGAAGLIVAVPGLSLLVLGAARTRALAFPLALVVFVLPVPAGTLGLFSLSTATAWLAEVWLGVLGYHAPRVENIFDLSWGRMYVSENCSGLALLYAAVLASLIIGHLTGRRLLGAGLLLLCWPLTALVNSFRVVGLVIISDARYGKAFIHSPFHGLSGIAAYWMVVVVILWLGHRFSRGTEGAR
jgi:exosortase